MESGKSTLQRLLVFSDAQDRIDDGPSSTKHSGFGTVASFQSNSDELYSRCLFFELARVGCSGQTNVVLGFNRPVKFVVLEMGMEIEVSM